MVLQNVAIDTDRVASHMARARAILSLWLCRALSSAWLINGGSQLLS
jgi:hypothetical protein